MPLVHDTYKYCVFDYDDTIMQTRECKSNALIALAERHFNKILTIEQIEQHWGIAHHKLFNYLFDIDGDDLHKAMEIYEALDTEFPLQPHREAKTVLQALQTKFRLVIVSSCTQSLIMKQLSSSSLSKIKFDAIFGAEDTSHHKPSGKVFDALFTTFPTIQREEVVYVGDGWKDAQAAQDAGLTFMGVDRSAAETVKMRELGASVFPSLSEIKDKLLA